MAPRRARYRTRYKTALPAPDRTVQGSHQKWLEESLGSWYNLSARDEELWRLYREEFGKCEFEDFEALGRGQGGRLRRHLLANGVWVDTSYGTTPCLIHILEEEEQNSGMKSE